MYRDHTRVIAIGRPGDRRGKSCADSIYDKHKDGGCEGDGGTDLSLEQAGCEIIRCAVPSHEAARALSEIKRQIHIPLVADIHFDIDWLLRPWKTERIRLGSIREISARKKRFRLL